jgi:hypothetical protein
VEGDTVTCPQRLPQGRDSAGRGSEEGRAAQSLVLEGRSLRAIPPTLSRCPQYSQSTSHSCCFLCQRLLLQCHCVLTNQAESKGPVFTYADTLSPPLGQNQAHRLSSSSESSE